MVDDGPTDPDQAASGSRPLAPAPVPRAQQRRLEEPHFPSPSKAASRSKSAEFHFQTRDRCQACGEPRTMGTLRCAKCGFEVREQKDRSIAIILAVFFSFVTWAYTYERTKTGFWVGLLVTLATFVLAIATGSGLIGILNVVVWITAIVSAARRSKDYYLLYPHLDG